MLDLDVDTIYQAIGRAAHHHGNASVLQGLNFFLKAYAPAFAGKMAIEAVDRSMRGRCTSADLAVKMASLLDAAFARAHLHRAAA